MTRLLVTSDYVVFERRFKHHLFTIVSLRLLHKIRRPKSYFPQTTWETQENCLTSLLLPFLVSYLKMRMIP